MDKVNFPNHMYKFIIIFKDGIHFKNHFIFFQETKKLSSQHHKRSSISYYIFFPYFKSNLKY